MENPWKHRERRENTCNIYYKSMKHMGKGWAYVQNMGTTWATSEEHSNSINKASLVDGLYHMIRITGRCNQQIPSGAEHILGILQHQPTSWALTLHGNGRCQCFSCKNGNQTEICIAKCSIVVGIFFNKQPYCPSCNQGSYQLESTHVQIRKYIDDPSLQHVYSVVKPCQKPSPSLMFLNLGNYTPPILTGILMGWYTTYYIHIAHIVCTKSFT